MRPIPFIWLLFAAISVEYLQAASVELALNSSKADQLNYHQPNHSSQNDSIHEPELTESPTIISGKFVILATGNEIKLYPFKQASSAANEEHILDSNYYLIQPRLILDEPCEDTYNRLGENNLTRWMCSKSKLLNGTRPHSASISIIPDQQAEAYDHRWKEPFITDVDFFFNSSYCAPDHDEQRLQYLTTTDKTDSSCLVVVWLDKRNKYVRYGSLDLRTALVEHQDHNQSTSKGNRERILWLQEYPAFNLNYPVCYGNSPLEVYGMAVEKRRQRLHLAFGSPKNKQWMVISSGFWRKKNAERGWIDDDMRQTSVFNDKLCSDKRASDDNHHLSLESLNVDPETGHWLFYLDKRKTSSSITALGLNPKYAMTMQVPVRDIQNSENTPLGIAIDSHRRRLYWLSTARELYECSYAGKEARLIGKLSQKPAIRSIQSMQVLDGILYLSDPIKKSLIAYKLDRNDTEGEGIDPFATHQVLLVELSNILGFRLIKLNSPDYRPPDREQSLSKYLKILDPLERHGFTKMIAYLFGNQTNDEYDDLVEEFRIRQPTCSSYWFEINKAEELRGNGESNGHGYTAFNWEFWMLYFLLWAVFFSVYKCCKSEKVMNQIPVTTLGVKLAFFVEHHRTEYK